MIVTLSVFGDARDGCGQHGNCFFAVTVFGNATGGAAISVFGNATGGFTESTCSRVDQCETDDALLP